MRLAAIVIENDAQTMLTACAAHKYIIDEWAHFARNAPPVYTVSEGTSFGECPAHDQGEHVEYTE